MTSQKEIGAQGHWLHGMLIHVCRILVRCGCRVRMGASAGAEGGVGETRAVATVPAPTSPTLAVRRLPLLLVLGGTVTAFGLFWYRKGRYDPTFLTEDSTRKGGELGNPRTGTGT